MLIELRKRKNTLEKSNYDKTQKEDTGIYGKFFILCFQVANLIQLSTEQIQTFNGVREKVPGRILNRENYLCSQI